MGLKNQLKVKIERFISRYVQKFMQMIEKLQEESFEWKIYFQKRKQTKKFIELDNKLQLKIGISLNTSNLDDRRSLD